MSQCWFTSCRWCAWHGTFCSTPERLGCPTTRQTRGRCLCRRTRIGQSVSCTVERCGSHKLDCSVAKQSLVALSSGEAEFYGTVRTVATSKQTSQSGMKAEVTIASDGSEARGICTRTTFQLKSGGNRRLTTRRSSCWCRWTRC